MDDGQGNRYQMLDDRGYASELRFSSFMIINDFSCAIDIYIMNDLTYESTGNAKAWVESHVFKYADKPTVYFQCSVTLCNRGESACTSITVLIYSNFEFRAQLCNGHFVATNMQRQPRIRVPKRYGSNWQKEKGSGHSGKPRSPGRIGISAEQRNRFGV